MFAIKRLETLCRYAPKLNPLWSSWGERDFKNVIKMRLILTILYWVVGILILGLLSIAFLAIGSGHNIPKATQTAFLRNLIILIITLAPISKSGAERYCVSKRPFGMIYLGTSMAC